MESPCHIDRTKKILLNPMIEYMKSALELYIRDFSYEAVFHYLRSGLADLTWEEADLTEPGPLHIPHQHSVHILRNGPHLNLPETRLQNLGKLFQRNGLVPQRS